MSDAQITVQSETHSLVVNEETYSLTKIPDANSGLVQAAIREVLSDLSLATVLTDLDLASDLIYLAYNGVAGMGVLAASVSSKQKKLGDLCADCVVTMTAFRQGTQDILGNLLDAFEKLLKAKEEIALEILAECGSYAKQMSDKCKVLADGFNQLKVDTQKDSESVEIAVGNQLEKLKAIKKLRDEMSATLEEQKKNSEELIARVEELKQDIAETKEEEAKESQRAFIGGMVGALAGAVGTGLGAFVASQNPIGTAVARMTPPAGGSAPQSGGGGEVSPEKVAEAQAKKEAAEKAAREKQAAVDLANQKLEAAAQVVEAARKELETKKDAAKKARDSGDAGAIAAADEAVEKADTALQEAMKKENEATTAQREAKRTLEDSTAAAAGASAALNTLSQSMLKMSEADQQRADKTRTYRMSLLSEKREQERLKRESLGQIAKLTSQLQSSDDDKVIEESSQYALEMAVWAFANIYAALSDAKFFWDSMAAYCERLSDPQTVKLIRREMRDDREDKEERIKYYSSLQFLQTAIFYLVRWRALETICDQYVIASEAARTKVINNIRKSPTIAEARAQLADLKKSLQAKLEDDMSQSALRSEAIEAQQKLLQSVK
jgi:hypothetical protein